MIYNFSIVIPIPSYSGEESLAQLSLRGAERRSNPVVCHPEQSEGSLSVYQLLYFL